MHYTLLAASHPIVTLPVKMDAKREQEYYEQADRWSIPPVVARLLSAMRRRLTLDVFRRFAALSAHLSRWEQLPVSTTSPVAK
jgi:hypothetical protein